MKGFINIGNTCYLNSGLQMLIQNGDLCELILKYSAQSKVLNKISKFINEYYSPGDIPISPLEIKKIVEQKQDMFMGWNQHDSTEFIVHLLDTIDEEIKKIEPESHGIEPIFKIDFTVHVKCKLRSCLKIYSHNEKNNFLLLDIDDKCTSLNDAYRNHKSSEKLDSDNKYFCENCSDKRIASKRCEISKWPKYLFIWLKRFSQNGRKITKNTQPIDVDLEWRHGNKLQGDVIHSGGLNGGHYIYVGKQNNQWYIFDDSSVTEISSEDELKELISTAYWLCYKSG